MLQTLLTPLPQTAQLPLQFDLGLAFRPEQVVAFCFVLPDVPEEPADLTNFANRGVAETFSDLIVSCEY